MRIFAQVVNGLRTAAHSLTLPIGGCFPDASDLVVRRRQARSFPVVLALLALAGSTPLLAQGGEADLKTARICSQGVFLGGVSGPTLLMVGLGVSVLGFVFGMAMYTHLRNLPVHASMLEISELIYETCKTYLITQGKFLLILEVFIGVIIVLYFGVLQCDGRLRRGGRSFWRSAWSGSRAATAWRGSAFA